MNPDCVVSEESEPLQFRVRAKVFIGDDEVVASVNQGFAERISDPEPRRAWLTFVIVGAGATGVEVSGTISEIARQTLKNDFRSIHPDEAQVILLDAAPQILMPFPEELAQRANRSLTKLGVQVKCGVMVSHVYIDDLIIESSGYADSIASKAVIWAGGIIMASPLGKILASRTQAEFDKSERVK